MMQLNGSLTFPSKSPFLVTFFRKKQVFLKSFAPQKSVNEFLMKIGGKKSKNSTEHRSFVIFREKLHAKQISNNKFDKKSRF